MKTSVKYQIDSSLLKRYPGMRTNILNEMKTELRANEASKLKLTEKTCYGFIVKSDITTFTLKKCN